LSENNSSVRLNKFIAQCGITSRRGADDLVFAGKVKVNGTTADSPGIKVDPGVDVVEVNGVKLSEPPSKGITLLFHKPVEVVTTVKDPQGRETVMDFLPDDVKDLRPFPVGRLDFFSEGLLLMTTDGDLCHRLTHPKWHLPKVYDVTIRGTIPDSAVAEMRSGMVLDGDKVAPAKIRLKKPLAGSQVMEITLIQGINRQIRRMCEQLGLTILRLRRVQQGPISLGTLKRGQWRPLDAKELAELRKAVRLD